VKGALRLHVVAAFRTPSSKQIEAYARFLHTLAAAAVIGAITLVFAEGGITWSLLWRLIGLVVSGVTCFLMGAAMLEDR
jgi:hypothetical protein